jgi:hypothetical protein
MMTSNAGWRSAVFALALAAVLMHATAARAAYMSFSLNAQPGAGRISFAGMGAPLVGTDLGVLAVKGLDTPSNADVALALSNGSLNFSTGTYTGATPENASLPTSPKDFHYAPGGTLTISGGVPALGIPNGTPLLTGSFSDSAFVRPIGTANLDVQGGAFINVVNDKLAQYFGLPVGGTLYTGGLSTLFAAIGDSAGAFSSTGYTNGQVTTTPVPEPTTLAVFAVALGSGLAWYHRRRAA